MLPSPGSPEKNVAALAGVAAEPPLPMTARSSVSVEHGASLEVTCDTVKSGRGRHEDGESGACWHL
jgi:hypothetical protein